MWIKKKNDYGKTRMDSHKQKPERALDMAGRRKIEVVDRPENDGGL